MRQARPIIIAQRASKAREITKRETPRDYFALSYSRALFVCFGMVRVQELYCRKNYRLNKA